MGLSINNNGNGGGGGGGDGETSRTHKVFLVTNYLLLGAASSCIFLTLSLRLIPSLVGALLILLHLVTIAGAVSGCAAARRRVGGGKFYAAHMVATVLTAIFQGSVAVLVFTRPDDFLARLDSYVREADGVHILRLAGGLGALAFALEWAVLTLAFFLNYYAHAGRPAHTGRVQDEGELKTLPWPTQV